MAVQFHLPVVTAAQVGTYFVGQYYQVLQNQPELVHQFYSEASTMVRVDGSTRDTAAAMLQIHKMVMALNYAGIEIKTVNSLESWNRGVLVMLSGSVLINGFNEKRRFVQTFFLAPQETGYFVLSDIFQFIEEEAIHHHPVAYLGQSTLDPKVNILTSIQRPVSNYMQKGENQSTKIVAPADIKENGSGENHVFPEQPLQQPAEVENNNESLIVHSINVPLQNSKKSMPDHVAAPVEDLNVEPQKHTYASILQVSKGPSVTTMPPRPSSNKTHPPVSEWDQMPEPQSQQFLPSSTALERSVLEAKEDPSGVEEEAEVKSVYVKNIPHTVSAYEIEEVFKKFGQLKPDAVAIRNRKDIGVCYAFVEFEDIVGVQNAIQASTVELDGQQVFIEGRRANRANAPRGGRIGRGRGLGGYNYREAPRGRFAPRNYSRGNGQEGNRDYNRPKTNGFYRPATNQDGGYTGNRRPRSGVQNESE